MDNSLPVLIAGGGIGGLAAALGLAQKGIGSILLEKAARLGEIGVIVEIGLGNRGSHGLLRGKCIRFDMGAIQVARQQPPCHARRTAHQLEIGFRHACEVVVNDHGGNRGRASVGHSLRLRLFLLHRPLRRARGRSCNHLEYHG